jgi:hypothetical protein
LQRAKDLRGWLVQRPEQQVSRWTDVSCQDMAVLTAQIVLVTHGAFAHFLTEDWDVADPMTGTAWKNCVLARRVRPRLLVDCC